MKPSPPPQGMWVFKSPAGLFWIKPTPDGQFALGIDDEMLRLYESPIDAADDVSCCASGCYEWDQRAVNDQPMDLCEWNFERF